MKQLLTATFAIAALLSGGAAYAKPTHSKSFVKVVAKKDNRAEKTRRSIVADLQRRGSNIPPAFSADGHWTR